jgi:DNA-binding LacI/PurR family transcriptional regulator
MEAAGNLPPAVDALICATDQVAMGALHTLNGDGQHIAVTGFDDIEAARQFIPAVTTIRQPIAEMARAAMNAIIENTAPNKISLLPELKIRRSSTGN